MSQREPRPANQLSIAIVCPEYRTDVGGAGGLAAEVDFLTELAARVGWQTDVYSPRMSRTAPESRQVFRPSTWFKRIRVVRRDDGVMTVGAHLAEFEPARYLPRAALTTELDRHDVIVVISGSPAAATITTKSRRPVVLHAATMVAAERARSIELASGARRAALRGTTALVDRMDRRVLSSPDHVLLLNPWMRSEVLRHGAVEATVAPPGVDTLKFSPAADYAVDGPIVMVARLGDARKDYSTLFRAYASARDQGLAVPLVLAGRGSLLPKDQALLSELDLGNAVDVRSDVTAEELADLLRSSSLFAFSSSEEGLGISIVEAMACGLPVVATATEGAKFVLEDPAVGEMVPVGDAAALATAMLRWIGDPKRRELASAAARKRALDVFSIDAAQKTFVDVITAAASRSASAGKVAVFAPYYPPAYLGGGPARSLQAIVSTAPRTYTTYVLSRDRDLGSTEPLGVERNVWTLADDARVRYTTATSLRMVTRSLRSLRAQRPEVLYLNSFFDVMFSIVPQLLGRLGWWGSAQCAVAVRGEFGPAALAIHRGPKRIYLTFYRVLRFHRKVVWHATSDAEAADIRRVMGRQAKVVVYSDGGKPPVVDPTSLHARHDAPLRLAFLGRIVPIKGILDALSSLTSATSVVDFDIYGPEEDADYASACRSAAASLPPNVRVRFCGQVKPELVADVLAAYDGFLMPTHSENFGHVIGEALAAGLPVLVRDVTPWTPYIRSGGGTVVPHATGWGSAVDNLARKSPEQRLQARRAAVSAYRAWEADLPTRHLFDHLMNSRLSTGEFGGEW